MRDNNELRIPLNSSVDERLLPQQLSDDQLLVQARAGDDKAFAELFLRYQGMLKRTIFRILRHREDTEDVVQETVLRAYQHLNSFEGNCKFSTWIISIGINASLMLMRKRRRSPNAITELAAGDTRGSETLEIRDPRPNPEQCRIMSQTNEMVHDAMQRLPIRLRSLMDLHYRKNHPIKDAALTLGITETAAKSRILRARYMLRRSLKREGLWRP